MFGVKKGRGGQWKISNIGPLRVTRALRSLWRSSLMRKASMRRRSIGWRRAAGASHPPALRLLGIRLSTGRDAPGLPVQGAELIRQAAQLGDAEASLCSPFSRLSVIFNRRTGRRLWRIFVPPQTGAVRPPPRNSICLLRTRRDRYPALAASIWRGGVRSRKGRSFPPRPGSSASIGWCRGPCAKA
jgi:hypothetical protein